VASRVSAPVNSRSGFSTGPKASFRYIYVDIWRIEMVLHVLQYNNILNFNFQLRVKYFSFCALCQSVLHALLHRFATLATRMEQYIQGQSRDLVDQAYTKFVSVFFSNMYSCCCCNEWYSALNNIMILSHAGVQVTFALFFLLMKF
jgi:hypothetical protein